MEKFKEMLETNITDILNLTLGQMIELIGILSIIYFLFWRKNEKNI